jgi:preprotein translocase subunit SecG
MFTALLILQVVLALTIIGLVLLQQGKGADMGAAFGSGASGTVFGARGGGSFFSRATAVLAAGFFINSVLLSSPLVLGERHPTSSVTNSVVTEMPPAAPAAGEDSGDDAVDLPPADLPEVDTGEPAADLPAATETPAPAGDAATADETAQDAQGEAPAAADKAAE